MSDFFFLEHAGELRIIVLIEEEKGVIHRPKHTHHTCQILLTPEQLSMPCHGWGGVFGKKENRRSRIQILVGFSCLLCTFHYQVPRSGTSC